MKTINLYLSTIFLFLAFILCSCTDDSETNLISGTLTLKITDAASDNDEIDKIFLTISDVKMNEKSVRGFEPQTIDISSLIAGKTHLLLRKELPAKEKNQLTLVFSAEAVTGSNQPGCYVLTKDNIKHNLFKNSTSEIEIVLSNDFDLTGGKETNIIADFDLRKAIINTKTGPGSYSFVTDAELKKAIRLIDENKTGSIYGSIESRIIYDHDIYVLIYKAGEFNATEEGKETGPSKLLFANAVSSAKMAEDGTYEVPFLEEGKYDIRLAGFRKDNSEEDIFMGFLPTTSRRTGTILNNIEVQPDSNINVNIEIFRLL